MIQNLDSTKPGATHELHETPYGSPSVYDPPSDVPAAS